MNKISRLAATAAAAVMLTATAVPVVPSYAETYIVEHEALAGKTSVKKLTVGKIADQTYTGKAIKPSVTVKNGKTKLKAGTDYTLSYKNNTKVGTATVTITGKGKYTGKRSVTFKIVSADAKDLKVTNRIKWLAWYDIEDENDEAQKLFRETYGTPKKGSDPSAKGRIFEFINVSYADRLNKLTDMIQSGNSPDLYPFELSDYPYGVLKGRYQSVDKLIDLNSDEWAASREAMEQFAIGGKHYCAFTDTSFGSLLYYRKSVIKEAGLKDPRKLFDKDQWTWDAFLDMARAFKQAGTVIDNYAIDGYNCADYFIATTGVPMIGSQDGKLVNNINSPELERAEELLATLQKENLRYPRHELNGWSVNTKAWVNGNTLFYANGGTWEFDTLAKYGKKMGWKADEIGVVPYPRDPQSDKYYQLMSQNAFMWCKGSKNKNGVSAWLNSVAKASQSSSASAAAKKSALEAGWTAKNWDFVAAQGSLSGSSKLTPVFDMKNGIGSDIADSTNSDSTVMQITERVYLIGDKTFKELRESSFATVDKRVEQINNAV